MLKYIEHQDVRPDGVGWSPRGGTYKKSPEGITVQASNTQVNFWHDSSMRNVVIENFAYLGSSKGFTL